MKKGRTQNPLVIFVVRKDILLMCARERIPISMTNLKTWVIVISAISKVIRHMTIGLAPSKHQDLEVTVTTIRSMDIEPLNANLSLCGHQTNQKKKNVIDITTIGTTTLGKATTIIKSIS